MTTWAIDNTVPGYAKVTYGGVESFRFDATGVSKVQDAYAVVGPGQTEQNVIASRALGTTYPGHSTRTIRVTVNGIATSSSTQIVAFVGGLARTSAMAFATGSILAVTFDVPPGGTYSVVEYNSALTLANWRETR